MRVSSLEYFKAMLSGKYSAKVKQRYHEFQRTIT